MMSPTPTRSGDTSNERSKGRWWFHILAQAFVIGFEVVVHGISVYLEQEIPIYVYVLIVLNLEIILGLILTTRALHYLPERVAAASRNMYKESFDTLCVQQSNLVSKTTSAYKLLHDCDAAQARDDIPGIRTLVDACVQSLSDLANPGKPVIVTSRHAMHGIDVKCLALLQETEFFRATVPTRGSADDIREQLSAEPFVSYIGAQKEAAKRGVRVQRLYMFASDLLETDPYVHRHLDELIESGIEVR